MHPIIEAHREELAALCAEFGVSKLEVFGSICRGTFEPGRSDLDFIATFADRGPGYADRYLDFADAVQELFGRDVDVVTPYSIKSPLFRESVDECRQVVYEQTRGEAAA